MGNTTIVNPTVTADEKVLLERLRADCDVAFRNWTAQVRVLQSIASGEQSDSGAIEQARRWASEAAAIYREKRNLFVELMIASQAHRSGVGARSSSGTSGDASTAGPSEVSAKDRARQVERIARQIWEESGRPTGSAEDDWLQAEKILDTRR